MDGLNTKYSYSPVAKESNLPIITRAVAFSGLIFFTVFIIYLGLSFGYKPLLRNSIASIDANLKKISSANFQSNESRAFLNFYSQSVNVAELLKKHSAITPVLFLIEDTTRNDVTYQSIQIDRDSKIINFSGVAKDYNALASQLSIYDNLKEVRDVVITGSRQSVSGIAFDFKLVLEPSVFTFQPMEQFFEDSQGEFLR